MWEFRELSHPGTRGTGVTLTSLWPYEAWDESRFDGCHRFPVILLTAVDPENAMPPENRSYVRPLRSFSARVWP